MRIDIRALADKQALPRVVHFARRTFLPSLVLARLVDGTIDTSQEVPDLSAVMAQLTVEKMLSSVLVEQAVLSRLTTHSIDGIAS